MVSWGVLKRSITANPSQPRAVMGRKLNVPKMAGVMKSFEDDVG